MRTGRVELDWIFSQKITLTAGWLQLISLNFFQNKIKIVSFVYIDGNTLRYPKTLLDIYKVEQTNLGKNHKIQKFRVLEILCNKYHPH